MPFRPVLGPTKPHIQWVTGTISLKVRRPKRDADYTSKKCQGQEYVDLYIHSPIHLHSIVPKELSTGTTLLLSFCLFMHAETDVGLHVRYVCKGWAINRAPHCDLQWSIVLKHVRYLLSHYNQNSRDSSVGIADDWGVGVRVPVGSRIFSSFCPDQLWSSPSLLSNG
jgi:hypothetical protein